jgi:hypothetical protein
MLLAEDLLLLLTDDDTGRLVVRDPSPAGEEPFDRALTVAQRREGKKPRAVLGELAKHLRDELYERPTTRPPYAGTSTGAPRRPPRAAGGRGPSGRPSTR